MLAPGWAINQHYAPYKERSHPVRAFGVTFVTPALTADLRFFFFFNYMYVSISLCVCHMYTGAFGRSSGAGVTGIYELPDVYARH